MEKINTRGSCFPVCLGGGGEGGGVVIPGQFMRGREGGIIFAQL